MTSPRACQAFSVQLHGTRKFGHLTLPPFAQPQPAFELGSSGQNQTSDLRLAPTWVPRSQALDRKSTRLPCELPFRAHYSRERTQAYDEQMTRLSGEATSAAAVTVCWNMVLCQWCCVSVSGWYDLAVSVAGIFHSLYPSFLHLAWRGG